MIISENNTSPWKTQKEQLSMRKTKWILSKRKLQQNNYTVKFISSLQNLPDLNTVDSVISFPLTNVRLFSQGIIFTTPAINRARAQMLIMAVSSSSFFFDCSWRCQQCYRHQNTKNETDQLFPLISKGIELQLSSLIQKFFQLATKSWEFRTTRRSEDSENFHKLKR